MPKLFRSLTNDPYVNLAIENELLRNHFQQGPILFLYVNRPCIVSGRFQNPWRETNWPELAKSGIDFVRRQSGGGTVYHDLGNLNYSFIHPGRDTHQKENHHFISNALESLGVQAIIGEKGDLLVTYLGDTKKVSGSAFKQTKDSSFHHGTLLLNANLAGLRHLLRPAIEEMHTKSIPSRPFPVANLIQLRPDLTIETLISEMASKFERDYSTRLEVIDGGHKLVHASTNYAAELQTWVWKIAETPKFEFESCGKWLIEKGLIVEAPQAQLIGEKFDQIDWSLVGLTGGAP